MLSLRKDIIFPAGRDLSNCEFYKEPMMEKSIEKYGELTFSLKVMKNKLSRNVYRRFIDCVENGLEFDSELADDVAHAMKEWALENGATHFTHWFQPYRSGTAEKHETFLMYEDSDVIQRFSGKCLMKSEPDASSFPSGGMRSTFEARGYASWDPLSQAFLLEAEKTKTLVIPSVFFSYSGLVLDLKTPMLRSQNALNKECIRLQKFLGNRLAKNLKVNIGIEQEYFLVRKSLFDKRPDLKICNRTLMGLPPVKGQLMEDHYFSSIKPEVLAFMEELDHQLFRRGIPVKTRHNEVAPNQFELAPLYEESNPAVDHNLQIMDLLQRVAGKHGFSALLHEKPFASVNGSGKHVNWSISDNTGANYLEPSKSPLKNIMFLLTIAAILYGIKKHGKLLRAVIADAGNEHRLGGNEAPPEIISVYLGDYLTNLFTNLENSHDITTEKMDFINSGLQNLPKISKDFSDRNRTSPFAFTGNKFEFRAVGSNQNPSEAITIINTITACGYNKIFRMLEEMEGNPRENAFKVFSRIYNYSSEVVFNGNCYCEEWEAEAQKRNLSCIKSTSDAILVMNDECSVKLFRSYKVLSPEELNSKVLAKLDNYINMKKIEIKCAVRMIEQGYLPVLLKVMDEASGLLNSLNQLNISNEDIMNKLRHLSRLYSSLKGKSNRLIELLSEIETVDSQNFSSDAIHTADDLLKKLSELISQCEMQLPESMLPFPSHEELLSI